MTTMNLGQRVDSGTRPPPLSPAPVHAWSYGRLWARVPGTATYAFVVFALAMASVGVLTALFSTGVGLLVIVVGLPILLGTLLVARGFATADRSLLRMTGLPHIPEPDWSQPAAGPGFWQTLVRPMRNRHYWAALLHGAIINPVISVVSFTVTVVWLSTTLSGLVFITGQNTGVWGAHVGAAVPWLFGGMSPVGIEILLRLLAGVLFGGTLPWVLGGLAAMHHGIARVMLGPSRADALAIEVQALDASRGAAVHAEDVAIRRLERDIHDGPQQRLVRMQMDLAALERRLDAGDSAGAREVAGEARVQAKATLDELRALSSGMAPPLLQDRGLRAALASIAAQSAIPVVAELDPALDGRLAPGVERSAYFVVAELLANAAKHAQATALTLRVSLRRPEQGAAVMTELDIGVVDNGRGGAAIVPGHGLAGMQDRVQGLRGRLSIDSPDGGPTIVRVQIPVGGGVLAR